MGFFDKLKKSVEVEEKAPEDKEEKKSTKKAKKMRVGGLAAPEGGEPRPESSGREPKTEEGQLAIDVYETNGDFVIQSTIAGVKAENLDITVENDMVTIRGSRQTQAELEGKKYYYQECYWGAFSRQVILPEEVDGSKAEATMKDGVLTLKIPKVKKIQKRKITVVKQEE